MKKQHCKYPFIMFSLLVAPAIYATQAADSMIESAQKDLERYEIEANQLQLGNRVAVQRIARFLPLIEGRLASSTHQGDPSWHEAKRLLESLKLKLEEIQSGGVVAVGSVPRSVDAKPQPSVAITGDPLLRIVMQDLEQYERQASPLQPGEKGAAARISRSLAITESRLASSPHNNEPAWSTAKQRLDALKSKLALISSSVATPASDRPQLQVTAMPKSQTRPQVEQQNRKPQPTDAALHKQFMGEYQDIRVSLPYLKARDMADPAEAARWQRALGRFTGIVEKFSDQNDPDVKGDLALYAEIKAKIEGAQQGAQAATGGLTRADLARDHQALEALVVKYQSMFEELSQYPQNYDLDAIQHYLDRVSDYIDSEREKEVVDALQRFSGRYGTTRGEIRKKFAMVNGGQEWLSDQRKVPEAGFLRLSEWRDGVGHSWHELLGRMEEDAAQVKRQYAVPGGEYLDLNHPLLLEGRVTEHFAKYRRELDMVLRYDPQRSMAAKLRGELDGIRQRYVERMNQAIDEVKWAKSGSRFSEPGNLDEIENAVKAFMQKKGARVLAVSIVGDWSVNERDLLGKPINYSLPVHVALPATGTEDTVEVNFFSMITGSTQMAPPFVKHGVGQGWQMRKANLP